MVAQLLCVKIFILELRTLSQSLNNSFALTCTQVGGIPPGQMPNQLQVHAFTVDDDQSNAHCSASIPFSLNSNGMAFIGLNESTCGPKLVYHRRYKTIITAKNDLGTTNSTGEILFSKLLYIKYPCSYNFDSWL